MSKPSRRRLAVFSLATSIAGFALVGPASSVLNSVTDATAVAGIEREGDIPLPVAAELAGASIART